MVDVDNNNKFINAYLECLLVHEVLELQPLLDTCSQVNSN